MKKYSILLSIIFASSICLQTYTMNMNKIARNMLIANIAGAGVLYYQSRESHKMSKEVKQGKRDIALSMFKKELKLDGDDMNLHRKFRQELVNEGFEPTFVEQIHFIPDNQFAAFQSNNANFLLHPPTSLVLMTDICRKTGMTFGKDMEQLIQNKDKFPREKEAMIAYAKLQGDIISPSDLSFMKQGLFHETGHLLHNDSSNKIYVYSAIPYTVYGALLVAQHARFKAYQTLFASSKNLPRLLTWGSFMSLPASICMRFLVVAPIFALCNKFQEFRADTIALQHIHTSKKATEIALRFRSIQSLQDELNPIDPAKADPLMAFFIREIFESTHPRAESRAKRWEKRAKELEKQGK